MIEIEARMTRVGTTHKPTLESCDLVFDFDSFGSTMPPLESWHATVTNLPIEKNTKVLVKEASSIFCGPRLVYMFRSTGYSSVQSEAMPISEEKDHFNGFVDQHSVLAAISDKNRMQIVDVRGKARFSGEEADPRPHVRAGHIPGSINMPYKDFIDDTNPRLLKAEPELLKLFERANIDLTDPIIFSCGSGITACIGALAAIACGARQCSVYDGSWSEWGTNPNLPVATSC